MGELRLIKGNANPELADKITKQLGIDSVPCELKQFADGEFAFQIKESIRGDDVFIIQSTQPPAENYLKLFLMLDAAKRASAGKVIAVIPYFGYARQDRKDKPRVPISAKLMANLITRAGADRVLTIDLHAPQIQGFFDIPVDNLMVDSLFKNRLEKKNWLKNKSNLVIVSPDMGGAKLAEPFLQMLGIPFVVERERPNGRKRIESSLAVTYKVRVDADTTKVVDIIGKVREKDAIMRDDIIDTGGSLVNALRKIKAKGANRVVACCTHALLADPATDNIKHSPLEKLIVTDTVPIEEMKRKKLARKLEVISVASLLAEAIMAIHEERSISVLFD